MEITASKYTHLTLNEENCSFAGYYEPQKEVRLNYNGREVLYVVGQAVIESSCCGAGGWSYIMVPGYIRRWQKETDNSGLSVSEVEPITDEEARRNISRIIAEREGISQVEFR